MPGVTALAFDGLLADAGECLASLEATILGLHAEMSAGTWNATPDSDLLLAPHAALGAVPPASERAPLAGAGRRGRPAPPPHSMIPARWSAATRAPDVVGGRRVTTGRPMCATPSTQQN